VRRTDRPPGAIWRRQARRQTTSDNKFVRVRSSTIRDCRNRSVRNVSPSATKKNDRHRGRRSTRDDTVGALWHTRRVRGRGWYFIPQYGFSMNSHALPNCYAREADIGHPCRNRSPLPRTSATLWTSATAYSDHGRSFLMCGRRRGTRCVKTRVTRASRRGGCLRRLPPPRLQPPAPKPIVYDPDGP
jgi:hypothetical protein